MVPHSARVISKVIILSVLSEGAVLIAPYFLQVVIDQAIPSGDSSLSTKLGLLFSIVAVMAGITTYFRLEVLSALGWNYSFNLARRSVKGILSQSLPDIGIRDAGDTVSRLQSVGAIRSVIISDAPKLVIDTIVSIITAVVILYYSLSMSFVSLAALLVFLLLYWTVLSKQNKLKSLILEAQGVEQSHIFESVVGGSAIRFSGQEAPRLSEWGRKAQAVTSSEVNMQKLSNVQQTLQDTVFSLENIVVVCIGVSLVIDQKLSLGMMLAFLAYRNIFMASVASIAIKFGDIVLLRAHVTRLQRIVDADGDLRAAMSADGEGDRGRIDLQGVDVQFVAGGNKILSDISLTVDPGSLVILRGKSGSGKTTLLRLIVGLVLPSRGVVSVEGRSPSLTGGGFSTDNIGVVFQDDILFSETVLYNITLMNPSFALGDAIEAAKLAQVDEDIRNLSNGYNTFIGASGAQMSAGQKQRIILARALIKKPSILLFDEGTSNLDADTEYKVNKVLLSLNMTRVIVAHRTTMFEYADRIYNVDDGKISADASFKGKSSIEYNR